MIKPTTASNWVNVTASLANELDLDVEGTGAVDDIPGQLPQCRRVSGQNQARVGMLVRWRQEEMRDHQSAAVQLLLKPSIVEHGQS